MPKIRILNIHRPYRGTVDYLPEFRGLVSLMNSNGIKTKNTRIGRYLDFIEFGHDANFEILIQGNKEGYNLLMHKEICELLWVWQGIKNNYTEDVIKDLRKLARGKDLLFNDTKTDNVRDIQFQLRILSYFLKSGIDARYEDSSGSDIAFTHGDTSIYVECKRIKSKNQLQKRIKEAFRQVGRRVAQGHSKHNYGIVVLDITKVAIPHGGLIWSWFHFQNKWKIQKAIKEATEYSKLQHAVDKKSNGVVFVASVPTYAIIPIPYLPAKIRFSNYFVPTELSVKLEPNLYKKLVRAMADH